MNIPNVKLTTIRVWDVFVRTFHWSLVLCIGIAWLSSGDAGNLHTTVGFIAGGLVLLRMIWGAIGSKYARFSQFVRAPSVVIAYLRDILLQREARYLGHNPAGGSMIVVLLALVSCTSISGWMLTTDAYWGVLWVQRVHGLLADSILVLLPLHIAGVLVASFRHRENLVRAMLTGNKRHPEGQDVF